MLKQITILAILAVTLGIAPTVRAAEALPNLIVTQFYVPAVSQYAGSPFNGQDIRVKVENIGLGTAVSARLDLVIIDASGTAVCVGRGKNLGEMPAYDTREYTFTRYEFIECPALAAGNYTLSAVADRGAAVAESSESDNSKTIATTVNEAGAGVALSALTASVSSASSQTVKIGYHVSQPTNDSRVEYAAESFYDELGTFDVNQSTTNFNSADYSAAITVSPEVPYRYRAVVGSSNAQTDSRIFILMKEVTSSVLAFTDLAEITELKDTSARLTWRTTQAAQATFTYEANNVNVNGVTAKTVSFAEAADIQSVTIADLTPDTKYYFKITAGSGAAAVSFTSFFNTNKAMYALPTPTVITTEPGETVIVTEPETPAIICDFATPGSLIKTADTPAVYYYGNDCKAYVFPNEKTYFTWYDDFSNVAVIPDASMAQISLGGNVTYRPGVKMVKMESSPNVYIVAKGGKLHLVKDEAQAAALYGSDWNKKIDDVVPAFFTDYEVGAPVTDVSEFAPEVLKAEAVDINTDKGL